MLKFIHISFSNFLLIIALPVIALSHELLGQVYTGVVFTLSIVQPSTDRWDVLFHVMINILSLWLCFYRCSDMILILLYTSVGLPANFLVVHFVQMKISVLTVNKGLLNLFDFLECEGKLKMAHLQVLLGVRLSKITL